MANDGFRHPCCASTLADDPRSRSREGSRLMKATTGKAWPSSLSVAVIGSCLSLVIVSPAVASPMTYTIDVQLDDPQIHDSFGAGDNQSAGGIVENGTFQVPILDPSKFAVTDVQLTLTTVLGGGLWVNGLGTTSGSCVGIVDVSLGSETLLQSGDAKTSDPGVHSFAYWVIFDHVDMPLSEGLVIDFFTGSPQTYQPGQFVPVSFSGDAQANSDQFRTSVLPFIRQPVLEITYTFDPLVDSFTSSDLPAGNNSTPGVVTYEPLGPEAPPTGLLPPYITVPEPSTWLLAIISLVGLGQFVNMARRGRTE